MVDISQYGENEIILNVISPNNVILISKSFQKKHTDTIELDLSQYSPGVYLISITSENGIVHIEKVIKT